MTRELYRIKKELSPDLRELLKVKFIEVTFDYYGGEKKENNCEFIQENSAKLFKNANSCKVFILAFGVVVGYFIGRVA